MFVIVIIIYLVIGILEIYPLVNKEQKKELIVYSIFFFTAFIISILLSFGVKIPSPAKPIETMVKAIIGK